MIDRDRVITGLLGYCAALNRALDALDRYERIYADATAPAGRSIGDGMPHAQGGHRGLDDKTIRITDAEDAYALAALGAVTTREQIELAVHRAHLTDAEADVITRKYLTPREICLPTVDGGHCVCRYAIQTSTQIAEDIGTTYAAVTHALGRAMDKLTREGSLVCAW